MKIVDGKPEYKGAIVSIFLMQQQLMDLILITFF